MRTSRLLTAAIAVALAIGAAAPLPGADANGTQHRARSNTTLIVWTQAVDRDFSATRLVIAGSHGRHSTVLTHPAEGVYDIDADISPDGRHVVFERDLPDGSVEIVVIGTDGQYEHALDFGCVDPCLDDVTPAWTPDSRHLVFTRVVGPIDPDTGNAVSALLYKSNLDGSHVVRLSPRRAGGGFASFAPAGYIVFVRFRDKDTKSALYRMSPHGTHLCQLTPWKLIADIADVSPAVSGPTRDLVVFETYGHGAPRGTVQAIATVSAADCSKRHRPHINYLTRPTGTSVAHFNPTWSPDGTHIGYVRFSYDKIRDVAHGDIWTMRSDGSHKRAIADSRLFDYRPDWGRAPS